MSLEQRHSTTLAPSFVLGHVVRMPYLTFSTFLMPCTFQSHDEGIPFHVVVNTTLLADGGVRKSANAKFWRARLESARAILRKKGLAHRYPMELDTAWCAQEKDFTGAS